MNWKEIKENYPKAWNKVITDKDEFGLVYTYLHNRFELKMDEYECYDDFNIRELYDFFDKNGIYIEICLDGDWNGLKLNGYFLWVIHTKEISYIESSRDKSFSNRESAEDSAFTKAFEILENKLK